ncbi:hypothetical protein OUZ56_005032 [Daphnia magna]|uniref:Uncharacterized protein n=1 Tax=Daphnia magna TaxID=35525 RepID=A0ABQ9YRL8_9CRUS|nr:hypothetical protein OUZ56_005032 [Daphnia magna]
MIEENDVRMEDEFYDDDMEHDVIKTGEILSQQKYKSNSIVVGQKFPNYIKEQMAERTKRSKEKKRELRNGPSTKRSRMRNLQNQMATMARENECQFLCLLMSKNDGFLYHNAEKERKMVHMLTKRLYTARKQIPKLHGKLETMLNDRKLAIVDLPSIREKLETQARLVGEPRLTNKWPLENLQRELEGICVVMRNLREREMRFADGCKARTVFRRKLTHLKARACDLIKLINGRSQWNITEEHRISGIFPWQTSGYTSVAEDFQLVDTWELHKRFQEEEFQTKREMVSFISRMCEGLKILESDIEKLSNEHNKLSQGKIILKNAEIKRLKLMLNDALFSFDVEFEFDEDALLEMEYEEEDIALERIFDEEELNDTHDHYDIDDSMSE